MPDFNAIAAREIKERISRIKKDAAPGPNGIMKKHIMRPPVRDTIRFFSTWSISGPQPYAWNLNRTTLIPKPGKDLNTIETYGPIKISFLPCRVY